MRIRPLVAALLAAVAAPALAGPIDPPAGPVAPTMKTIEQAEPRIPIGPDTTPGSASALYIINQSGSYYLTGNVTGVAGRHGILVTVSDVTIDLNGFELAGVASSLSGINATLQNNIRITNGHITGWSNRGVSSGQRTELSSVTISGCTDYGGFVNSGSVVRDCVFADNGTGLWVGIGVTVSGCAARGNTSNGFFFNSGCSFSRCVAYDNGGTGFGGPGIGSGVTIVDCAALANDLDGFDPHVDCILRGCVARSNGRYGFNIASNTLVTGCVATFSTEHGFHISGTQNRIIGCSAVNNGNNGDGSGIHVIPNRNHIERNHVSGNDRGISAGSFGGIYIGNVASGNVVNYELAAGNVALVVAAATSGAISGSSGGVSPGTTNPWANFSY